MPASIGVTNVTQWHMMAYKTTLKIVGDRGSPCVTHRYPLNVRPEYLPALATMVSQSQYFRRRRSAMGTTPYKRRSSRALYRYKEL